MFTGWCFYSHLVLWCTNGHQNKHIFSCLSLWDGAFTRILYFDVQTGTKSNQFFSCLCLWGGAFSRIFYFDVQTGTKTNLFQFVYVHGWCFYSHLVLWCTNGTKPSRFLVVYVYGVVLLLVSCTSMYKQAPNQNFF